MTFHPFTYWRRRRAISQQRRTALCEGIVRAAADRAGPPAIALARSLHAGDPQITIDPLETDFQVQPAGVAVRAWVLVPHAAIPTHDAANLATTTARLARLSPRTRRIFFLHAAYGIASAQIAVLLGLSRRTVRRAILRAIMALDTQMREG